MNGLIKGFVIGVLAIIAILIVVISAFCIKNHKEKVSEDY